VTAPENVPSVIAVVPCEKNHGRVVGVGVDSGLVIRDGPFRIGIFGVDFRKTVGCFLAQKIGNGFETVKWNAYPCEGRKIGDSNHR
jgi:hypothetical protein